MEIRYHSHVEPEDYFKFGISHAKKRIILTPTIALALITALYLIMYGVTDWSPELKMVYVAFAVFAIVLLPLLNIGMIKAAANRQYRTGVHHDNEQVISDEGLYSHNELGEVRMPWSHIHKATESKNAMYLYLSSAQAIILPKREFNDEQYAALHELCKKNIPPQRNKLKS